MIEIKRSSNCCGCAVFPSYVLCDLCSKERQGLMSKDKQQCSDDWEAIDKIKDKIYVKDMVNSPAHYTFGKIEVIDVLEDWDVGFHLGNTIKYIARAKHKENELEDLKKAQWYLNRKISQLEKG